MTSNLNNALKLSAQLIEKKIDEILPKNFKDSKLVEAMRYSALSGGKRVRPFLLMNTAKIFGVNEKKSLTAATALELIHTYSLVHDDLPAMDDDDLRRGKPTCHKKFDEATAILAGDALLTYAFEILATEKGYDSKTKVELISILAKASGFNGMAGGQMIDLELQGKKIGREKLLKLHSLKTGALFVASIEMGAAIGGATATQKKNLLNFAKNFGLAFQLKDDLLDGDEALSTKETERLMLKAKNDAILALKPFGKKAEILRELLLFVVERKD